MSVENEELEEELQQSEEEMTPEEQEEYNKVFFADEDTEAEPEPEAEPEAEEPEPEAEEIPNDETPEEEPNPEEEEPEDDPEAKEDPEDPAEELVTLKWRGKEIQATQAEVIAMAQQNFDSTHKWQEASDMKKKNKADFELLDRARKGDKKAISEIIAQGEIDPVDLIDYDPEDDEQGTADQLEPFISPEVSTLLEEVQQDEALFQNLQEIEQDLPQTVIDVMAKDPEIFYTIVSEVQSGDAKLVMPEVQKVIAQMSGIDKSLVNSNPDAYATLYMNVKNQMIQANQPASQKETPQKRRVPANELSVKKSGGQNRRVPKEVDSFNNDEAYQAILNRLEGN